MTTEPMLDPSDIFKHSMGEHVYSRHSDTERLSFLLSSGLAQIECVKEPCTRASVYRLPGAIRWYGSARDAIDAGIDHRDANRLIGATT